MFIQTQALGTDYLERDQSEKAKASMKEEKMLERARKFDQQALATIYDQYSSMIYRYAMRLVGDTNLAEEFVSETFTRFLNSLKAGKGPKQYLKAYLFRITHNLITDHYRRDPLKEQPMDINDEITADHEIQPKFLIEQKIELEQTRTALLLLTSDQSQVIALRYLEELSNEEVAIIMDKPVGAIKSLHHRAMVNLRKMLSQNEEDHE